MYIITSKTRSKMKRDKNSQSQLREERNNYLREQGVEKITPLKGQSEEKMFEDIKNAGSEVKESMQQRREEKLDAMKKRSDEKKQQRVDALKKKMKGL